MTELGRKEIDLFNKAVVSIVDSGDALVKDYDRFIAIYAKMYGIYPNIIDLDTEGLYLNKNAKDTDLPANECICTIDTEEFEGDIVLELERPIDKPKVYDDDSDIDEELKKFRFKAIDVNKTFIKLLEKYPDAGIIRNYDFPIFIYNKCVIFWNKYQRELTVLQDVPELYEWIAECVVEKEDNDDVKYFEYVTYGQNGFDTIALEVKKQDINLETNYNDNLPDTELREFLTSDESGLAVLYGKPGSGKSYYIRHLMYTLKKKTFLVLDASVFNYITDSSFISLLMDYKNAVIILEDCESMLVDRVAGNGKLSALLNLSDGIIGDAFNFKFICTFNANIGKIDKALLRKGRMKIKYEFKELTPEKTKALANMIGKTDIPENSSMTVSEIYNYGIVNDFCEPDKKIGFNK